MLGVSWDYYLTNAWNIVRLIIPFLGIFFVGSCCLRYFFRSVFRNEEDV